MKGNTGADRTRAERYTEEKFDIPMNGWLKKKADKWRLMRRREGVINSEIGDLWEHLKKSIMATANQYAQEFPESSEPNDFIKPCPDGFDEFTIDVMHGSQHVPPLGTRALKKKLIVSLNRDEHTITGKYVEGERHIFKHSPVTITVAVGESETACLLLNHTPVNLEEATEALLSPLLFPDLVCE